MSVCPIVSAQYLLKKRSTIFFFFFFTKLGMVVYFYKATYHAEKLVHYLPCQGHSEGLYNKKNKNYFLLYLLNCLFVCNHTWLDSTTWEAGVFCGKMGLLCSRSRSQRSFKMLVNVCPDDIFWTTEHFVAKPGMVMQHHKPKCHAEKMVHCVQCQGHSEGLYKQNMTISVVSSKLLVGLQPNLVW